MGVVLQDFGLDAPAATDSAEMLAKMEVALAAIPEAIEAASKGVEFDTTAAKLPELKPRDRQAWQLSLVAGMIQDKIADSLNREFPGENWTQPRVCEAIKRAQAHAEASGLADKVGVKRSKAPARTLDPAVADIGQRTDGRSKHLREKAQQMAEDE